MPDEPRTLVEACLRQASTHAGRPAVGDGGTTLCYDELAARATVLAARLRRHGVRPGDRVLIVGRNTTAWVVAAFGVLFAGATVVPIGHGSGPSERRRAVERLQPRIVLAEPGRWPEDSGPPVLSLPAEASAAPTTGDAPPDDHPRVDPESDALVLPTSGTSGTVRYVAMTHRQLCHLYWSVSRAVGVRGDDRMLGAVPLAHSFGLNGVLLIGLMAGAMVRLAPQYDRATLASLVREERLTVLAGPPTVYYDLAAPGSAPAGDSVRLAITGSTEVAADRMRATCDLLGIPEVVVGYGMTETCGTVALGRIPARVDTPAPLMTPVPGVEVQVLDALGGRVSPGENGRLLVRGPNVVHHYADPADPKEPASLPDGWLDTGDLATLDAQGRIAVVGRRKDTVIVSGFNVFPHEVEQVLLTHPQVSGAVVVGVPDERRGERLVACVVPDGDGRVEPEELVEHARAVLAAYKVPREYVVMDRLPTTATGKISRAEIRRTLGAG